MIATAARLRDLIAELTIELKGSAQAARLEAAARAADALVAHMAEIEAARLVMMRAVLPVLEGRVDAPPLELASTLAPRSALRPLAAPRVANSKT